MHPASTRGPRALTAITIPAPIRDRAPADEALPLAAAAAACSTQAGYAWWLPGPEMLATKVFGHGSATLASQIRDGLTPLFERGAGRWLFIDCWEMTGYEKEASVAFTSYLRRMRRHVARCTLLLRSDSPLLEAGAAASRRVPLRELRVQRDPAMFYRQLRERACLQ